MCLKDILICPTVLIKTANSRALYVFVYIVNSNICILASQLLMGSVFHSGMKVNDNDLKLSSFNLDFCKFVTTSSCSFVLIIILESFLLLISLINRARCGEASFTKLLILAWVCCSNRECMHVHCPFFRLIKLQTSDFNYFSPTKKGHILRLCIGSRSPMDYLIGVLLFGCCQNGFPISASFIIQYKFMWFVRLTRL